MADLEERLRLVVDASTQGATTAFDKLSATADTTSEKAKRAGQDVAATADAVAQARLKEQDAAGRLSVAETRLQELREGGRAKASQIAAAEERVASAQRQVQVATGNVTRVTEDHARAQRAAGDESERLARSTGVARGAIVNLATVTGALTGGALVAFIGNAAREFIDGARGAGQFATATNASVGEAGRLLGLVQSLGLDLNDLIEIQAEFAQKSANLGDLGVVLQRNADGTVNWTTTLEDTLVALQKIPDATERNRLGFQFFGEEGYKQLSQIVNSGQDVREVLDQIGSPFTDEDVRAAQEYDNALREASLTGAEVERALGRLLLPLLTGLGDGFVAVADAADSSLLPLGAATVAAIALGVTGFNPAAAAAARLAPVLAVIRTEVGLMQAAMITGGAAAGGYGAALGAAGRSAGALSTLLGGTLGVALLAGAGLYAGYSHGIDEMARRADEAAPSLGALADQLGSMDQAVSRQANQLDDGAGYWERFSAALDMGVNPVIALGTSFSDLNQTTASQIDLLAQAQEELEGFAEQQATTQITTKTLNDLIAEGTTSGSDFAVAVQAAAEAQRSQAETSGLAEAAIAAYNAVTTGAVEATINLANASLSARDTRLGFADSIDQYRQAVADANAAVDDGTTVLNEQETAQRRVEQAQLAVEQGALRSAQAAADAAVAGATAQGQIIDATTEAQLRADAAIADLQASLANPNLAGPARDAVQGLVDQLVTAKQNGNIEATLQTIGVGEATAEIDQATEDRDTTVTVESRGGPAVISYLDSIAGADRLALVRVETRNGPAVIDYLQSIATADRLALVRVESRGGPAVISYLDGIASQYRLAIINVETRGGPAVDAYLDSLTATRTAVIQVRQQAVGAPVAVPGGTTGVPMLAGAGTGAPQLRALGNGVGVLGSVTFDLELTGRADRSEISSADRGRAHVRDIQAYERQNGPGWRKR